MRAPLELRRQPVSFVLSILIAIWMIYVGVMLMQLNFPPYRLVVFKGPLALMDLPRWGVLFIIGGCLVFVRMMVYRHERVRFVIHCLYSAVVVAWAGAFFAGPESTGQPSFGLLAILVVSLPYIYRFAQHYLDMRPHDGGE